MTLHIPSGLLRSIRADGERSYPDEGAGLILGTIDGEERTAVELLPQTNRFEVSSRSRRYLITPEDMLAADLQAEQRGLEVIGVFHSHPDHPAQASEYDREWALPFYSYVITRVAKGRAVESRSWRLADGRQQMSEEPILVMNASMPEEVR